MGIPSYFSHIVRNYPQIVRRFDAAMWSIDHLYFDANSIIYDQVHANVAALVQLDTAAMYDHLIGLVLRKIDDYIALVRPRLSVVVAFDGVAPAAKMKQQRLRRYKSALAAVGGAAPAAINTTFITPGTDFMLRLNARLVGHFGETVHISGSDVSGEGEHKLFAHIRNNAAAHATTRTVVYGLDADLIVLGLQHLHVAPHLFLLREAPAFGGGKLEPLALYAMDIGLLAAKIVADDGVASVRDYIFLTFLLGNDFMPHFPALNIRTQGIARLLDTYRRVFGRAIGSQFVADGGGLKWDNVQRFIAALAEHEEEWCRQEGTQRDKMAANLSRRTGDEITADDAPMLDRAVELYIAAGDLPNWQVRYYAALIPDVSTPWQKHDMVQEYFAGLEWCTRYYADGCPDMRWMYAWDYPPLLADLSALGTTLADRWPHGVAAGFAVHPYVQLAYVLPREGVRTLLPGVVADTLLRDHADWYPDFRCETTPPLPAEKRYQWAYCRYLWEAHMHLPRLNLSDVEAVVSEARKM